MWFIERQGGSRCHESCIPEVMEVKHYGIFLNAEKDNENIQDFFGMHVDKDTKDILGDQAQHFKETCEWEKNN